MISEVRINQYSSNMRFWGTLTLPLTIIVVFKGLLVKVVYFTVRCIIVNHCFLVDLRRVVINIVHANNN